METTQTTSKKSGNGYKILVIVLAVLTLISVAIAVFISVKQIKTIQSYRNTKLVVYQGPKSMKTSATQIKVDGNSIFVYDTAVNAGHTWLASGNPALACTPISYFDFNGKVKVQITIPNKIKVKTCTVSPLSDKIVPQINGNTVSFDVSKSGDYTIQFNGSVTNAVHLFANPIETYVPDKSSPNLIYIGPGEWNIDAINLTAGQTLYISGGAVIHGTVKANMAPDVKILGRGIIDGSDYAGWLLPGQTARIPVDFEHCTDFQVDGIEILNPNAWTLQCFDSNEGTINNVKIVSARPNGDGITLQSCQNVNVTNSFVRTWDDSLVVKNYDVNTKGITFNNMQVWTDLAQSCEIGYETNKGKLPNSEISDVTFENIDVVNNFHKPVLGIHNSDNALIDNIHYKNITVENAQMGDGDAGTNDQLIDFDVLFSQWSQTTDRGNIRNVTIDGLNVLSGKFPPSRIDGYDDTHTIQNVSISNLTILGKKITSLKAGKFETNSYDSNITIK